MGGREQDAHRTALGTADDCRPFRPGVVHDRADVVHQVVERGSFGDPVRESRAAPVEHDHARERGEPLQPARPGRPLPILLEVRHVAGSHDDVYLTGLGDGWVEVGNTDLGLAFRLEFDERLFRWLISWQPYGGAEALPLAGSYALGIEPWTTRLNLEQAVAAGATEAMPVADMFWGDRYGKVVDPFGHKWDIATHVEDVAPEEMEERMKKAMSAGA